jgi:hypothetical protein
MRLRTALALPSVEERREVELRRELRKRVLTSLVLIALVWTPARATVLDLTTLGSHGQINGAAYMQFNSIPTGSGLIDSFLRIQGTGVQQGYNSDYRPVEFDEDTSPQFNHSVQLAAIPVCTVQGTEYREFILDINQNGQRILSLDSLQIALHTAPDLTGYASIFAAPIYDLDAGGNNWILLNYDLNGGSGHGDMAALIPNSLFTPGHPVRLPLLKGGREFDRRRRV